MKLKPENRAIEVLKYMLETKSSIVKTAKHFGVSQATIHSDIKTRIVKFADPKDLEKLKIIINNNKTVGLTVDEKEKINSEYNKGRSISSLAKETGHSKTSIKKHIKVSRCETDSHQLDVENRMAKVFDFTPDDLTAYQTNELIQGGTGYDMNITLPKEVEHYYPDYELYGITDTAYGYLTRGCPRHCPFCIVADKEGVQSVKVADLKEFWNGQKKIKLLDPNILACKDWKSLLTQLIDSRAEVDFTQGLVLSARRSLVIEF